VEAVVNVDGGSVTPDAAEELEALVSEFGFDVRVVSAERSEVESCVRNAVAADPDLVIVLAGDGTARLAADLCGPNGPLVMPLPGGTMNMLPNVLYNGLPWRDALKDTLCAPATRPTSGGTVDGQSFYVAAILGAPALWAPAREALRDGNPRSAWKRAHHAMARAFSHKLRFALDDTPHLKSEALAVMCPLVSKFCADESAFEASALDPEGLADVVRLGLSTVLGDWRGDPAVHSRRCQSARAWANRAIPGILDGEMQMFGREVSITFQPVAFRALVPFKKQEAKTPCEPRTSALKQAVNGGTPH
jgi:diacylglycerol kinase family enzyme